MASHYQQGVPDGTAPQYYQPQEATYHNAAADQGMHQQAGHHDNGTYATYDQSHQQYQQYQQPPVSSYAPTESHYAPTTAATEHSHYAGGEKNSAAAAAGAGAAAGYGGHRAAGTGAGSSSTIMGMKRAVFFLVVAIVVLLLALVIGLAAGLGVSQRNLRTTQSDLAAAQSSLSAGLASSPSSTPAPSATSSAASSSATAIASSGCPGKNGTSYTSTSHDNKQFKLLCGRDYAKGEADDIGSVQAATINDCMDACAAKDQCQGAGWGFLQGASKDGKNPCYMKTNMTGNGHKATDDWAFAVLQTSDS